MRTLEFKVRLSQSRVALIEEWLEGCRRIWNLGLDILKENQQWYWRQREGMTDDPYPVPWQSYCNNIGSEKVFGLYCTITVGRDARFACPIKSTPGNVPPTHLCTHKDPYMTLSKIWVENPVLLGRL